MRRVLVADDESLMREALSRMIKKIDGFEVVHAVDNGKDAVELCQKEAIDIVFLDIMMPEMNGIETGQRIKKINRDISIYILTAYNKLDYLQEAIKMKAEEYLLKPVSQSRIEELLRSHLKENHPSKNENDRIKPLLNFSSYREMYYGVPEYVKKLEAEAEYQEIISDLVKAYPQTAQKLRSLANSPVGHKKEFEYRLVLSMDAVYRDQAIEKHPIFVEIFKFLDDHLLENIGLTEITQCCKLSQGYLSRIFKEAFGISVMAYIHMRKMSLAKWYFLKNQTSLTDAAYRLGYNESSYFSKVFKKYEHVTVLEYKKSLNADCR